MKIIKFILSVIWDMTEDIHNGRVYDRRSVKKN